MLECTKASIDSPNELVHLFKRQSTVGCMRDGGMQLGVGLSSIGHASEHPRAREERGLACALLRSF